MKNWYKISDGVEYSTDFDFFVENQMFFDLVGSRAKFYSRLESKVFLNESDTFGLRYYTKDENSKCVKDIDYIMKVSKRIHQEILDGKHGTGEFKC